MICLQDLFMATLRMAKMPSPRFVSAPQAGNRASLLSSVCGTPTTLDVPPQVDRDGYGVPPSGKGGPGMSTLQVVPCGPKIRF